MVLRNVVPRQGTETTEHDDQKERESIIEKCSSPTGDGNDVLAVAIEYRISIEKCSSPTGDGNF